MAKQQLIKVCVTSYEGHSEFSLLPKQALAKIKQLEKEENKWTFIGGQITNTEMLTEKELIKAQDDGLEIMLVNALAGGNVEKPVEINFEVSKDIDGVQVTLEENKYVKQVNIFVSKEQLIDIIYDREVIIAALERKLEEFAQREVDGMRTALNV